MTTPMDLEVAAQYAPDGRAALWAQVTEAAGAACECDGSCGRSTHAKGCPEGRSKTLLLPRQMPRTVRWLVAPRDPHQALYEAPRLPAGELALWCTTCWYAAADRFEVVCAAERAAALTDAQEELW